MRTTLYAFGLAAALSACGCAHKPPEAPINPSNDPVMEKRREQQHIPYHPQSYVPPKRPVTPDEIRDRFGWPIEDCVKLSRGEVWIGMGYYMLLYLYGEPDRTNISNYGAGEEHQYCWTDRTPSCFYDKDGDGKIDAYN